MFLKSDKHNSFAYLLSYFYVKNFVILSVQVRSGVTVALVARRKVLVLVIKYIQSTPARLWCHQDRDTPTGLST